MKTLNLSATRPSRSLRGLMLLLGVGFAAAGHADPGAPLGPAFEVSASVQGDPLVARSGSGRFVVLWRANAYNAGWIAQQYDATGMPLGMPIPVLTVSTYSLVSNIASDDAGNFVLVWEQQNPNHPLYFDIYASRFRADGTAAGAPIKVAALPTTNSFEPPLADVAMNASGQFVVAWGVLQTLPITPTVPPFTINFQSIHGQLYEADGSPHGDRFTVQTNIPYLALAAPPRDVQPHVALDSRGRPVVAWIDRSSPLTSVIRVRQFGSRGQAAGPAQTVSPRNQFSEYPSITAAGDGSFVVAWAGFKTADISTATEAAYARRYAANGNPLGRAVAAPSVVGPRNASFTSVSASPTGDYVLGWSLTDFNVDGTNKSAHFAQMYAADGTAQGSPFQIGSAVIQQDYPFSLAVDAQRNLVATWNLYASDFSSNSVQAQLFSGQ